MTTARDIVTAAYRESNLIPAGDEPTGSQFQEGLTRLITIVSGAAGYEVGERLNDWPVGAVNIDGGLPYWTEDRWKYPVGDARLMINVQAPQTIFFPPDPDDGTRMAVVDVLGQLATYPVTLNGNGRRIENAATVVLATNGLNRTWMYRADLGDWVRVVELEAESDMPYPVEFDDAFILRLAMRLNPRMGKQMDEASVAAMNEAMSMLRARYRQRVVTPCDIGVLALTKQVNTYGYSAPVFPLRGRFGWMW